MNKFIKLIAYWLIILIASNYLAVFWQPPKAQAVDVDDHMLLFWPSADCLDTPSGSGWTAVSTGAGDFNAYFPRGATSYSGKVGGSSTHTHAVDSIVTTAGTTGGDRNAGTAVTGASPTHTHTNNTATVDAGGAPTVLPKFGEMCVISYDNGIPNGDTAIPDGAVAIFDSDPDGISGWSDYSSTFSAGSDTFIRGGTNGTGGDNNHGGNAHTLTNITLGNNVVGSILGQSSTKSLSSMTHTHTVPNTNSDLPDVQPPYMNIYLGQKSNNGPIPNGMIAMFQDTDSSVGFSVAGWTRLSDAGGPFNNRFLKVTGSYGTPGGNTTHTHNVVTTSNTGGNDVSTGKAGVGGPIMDHAHTVTINLNVGTNTNIPPYTDVVIAKKQTAITALTGNGPYNGFGDTVTIDLTANNYHASTDLANKYLDYVIFEDTITSNGRPDTGEKYVTANCAGSDTWPAGAPYPYTFRNTTFTVNVVPGFNTDQQQCANTNFPDQTTYTVWVRWWDGTSYDYNIYYEKSVTFYSVPTLGQIGFAALVFGAVYLAVKSGFISLNNTPASFQDSHQQNRKTRRRGEPLPFQNNQDQTSQSKTESTGELGRIRDPKRILDAMTKSKNSKQQNNEQKP